MKTDPIRRGWDQAEPPPPISDYETFAGRFRWDEAREHFLEPPPLERFNLAALAVDRHASGARRHQTAIRWIGSTGEELEISYGVLRNESNRFANVLRRLGVTKGQTVFTLLGRTPAVYVTALGTLKHHAVFCPLFSAFGPEPVHQRLALGEGRVLVTTERLYRRVVESNRPNLPKLEHVLIVGHRDETSETPGTQSYERLLDQAEDEYAIHETDPEDPAIMHFTSGTTGVPKGVVHVHDAAVAHFESSRFALDLRPGDLFWCTADPGWVTGTTYGIFAPLLHGATNLVVEDEFDGERWYRTIQDQKVQIFYTSPTAIRMLMKLGPELPSQFDFSSLRLVASVGEPLNPEAVTWGHRALGLPILDNWWQTETGTIMIANLRNEEIRPGSMGRPLPGIEARIVQRREDGGLDFVDEPNVEGEIALRAGWPSMMRGYLNQDERYQKCFREGWYLSDDLGRCDEDGYFWFLGRADDMIKTAGHRIGPFEIESVLMEHPAVAEAAAVGKPHPTAGAIVKAFVSLKDGYEPSAKLERELLALGRKRLGSVSAPREIEICERLPKTRSGKIVRRVLRALEAGEDLGDVSTLQDNPS